MEVRRRCPQSNFWALWVWRDMEGAEFRSKHNRAEGDIAGRLMPPLGAVRLTKMVRDG